uniref:Uncharacterized protein n=1 Tax=Tanacetum cinerariifolium TaxID=118510 RepID=A0A6L2LBQ6_TANCI|nr:hypothetical protein [Tanacetum cinerariifolium]
MAYFPRLNKLAVAANSRGLFEGMLVYCDRENARDLEFANGLDNLWVELLERANESQLFKTELEGLCPSAKRLIWSILSFPAFHMSSKERWFEGTMRVMTVLINESYIEPGGCQPPSRVGLSQLWDVLYNRVNELKLLSSELNLFGGPLAVQCVEYLKQLSKSKVLKMLELRKTIAEDNTIDTQKLNKIPNNYKSSQIDACGGSGSNSLVWPIDDDNGAVDMNGTMDNLEERITNLEMVFAYLKNKKILERQENKPKKETPSSNGTTNEDIAEFKVASKSTSSTSKPKKIEDLTQKNPPWITLLVPLKKLIIGVFRLAFDPRKSSHYKVVHAGGEAEGLNRELKQCKLNMEDHDHPIMTSLEIAHELHRGRKFLESFGRPINDPILLLMELPHMLHLKGKIFESFRYRVNIVQLLNPFPEGWSIRTCVWSICLGEGEEDAFVVINLSRLVVKYNLISKTNTEIFDIGSNQMDDDDDGDDDAVVFIPPFEVDLNLYEFIPSLASV